MTTPLSTAEQSPATEPDPRRWLALVVIAVTQLMIVLDATIVNIALPQAQQDLGISDADRQWVVTAYTLAFGGLLLLGGRVADYVGRKKVLIIGLAGFAAASALGGIANGAPMLFGARALQGVFAALMAPAALSLISVTFTDVKERAKAFGVYGAIAGGGAAIGLIAGGLLTDYASWRWCLLVNTPVAIGSALAAQAFVHESKAEGTPRYDFLGAGLVTAGLLSLVYGFTQAAKDGWTDSSTLSFIVVAVALLAAFAVVEQRVASPLLPMRVPLERNRGGSFLASLLVGSGLFAMFLFLAYYFQINLGYSPLRSGFAFLPFSAGIVVSAGLASQLLPRTGPRPLMIGGLVAATVGMSTLLLITNQTAWWSHVLPAEVLMSLGMGFVFVPLSSTALIGVDHSDAGVASALLNTTQQVGGSLGTALLNTLYASAVTAYLADHARGPEEVRRLQPDALVHGYHVAFFVGMLLIAAAAVSVAVLVRAGKDEIDPHAMMTAL